MKNKLLIILNLFIFNSLNCIPPLRRIPLCIQQSRESQSKIVSWIGRLVANYTTNRNILIQNILKTENYK